MPRDPKETADPATRALASLMRERAAPPGPHLTDAELRAIASEGLEGAAAERADQHLEACIVCQERLVVLLPPVTEDEPAGEAAVVPSPPLLALVGRPEESLKEVALATGLPVAVLEQALEGLRSLLGTELADLLAAAERMANRASDGRFEAWKARQPALVAPSESTVAAARESIRSAVSTGSIRSNPTRGPERGNPHYELRIAASDTGLRRAQCLLAPGAPPRPWWFRLVFEPNDEAVALRDRGFTPAQLGALRCAYGERAWPTLLDLVLPWRYGASGDPLYDRAMKEGLPGRPPGEPTRVIFEVGGLRRKD